MTDHAHLAAQIVSAFVSNNPTQAGSLPDLIRSVHAAVAGLGTATGVGETNQKPAVPIKRSITPEYIVCLEDGKKLKMMKRYLRGQYDMTPEQYREKWGLPRDYPMVAPNYSEQRSVFAKKIGLGRVGKPASHKKAR